MAIDLHCHTVASDGTLTASELVDRAAYLGIDAISVTDHDSVGSVAAALEASAGTRVRVVPGVELSARTGEFALHVLGYFIDPAHAGLLERLADLRDARQVRAAKMVDMMDAAGFEISMDDVLAFAQGEAVGRSHIARAIVARGHAADLHDAFARFVGRDAPYHVPKPVPPPDEVIALIREAGGIAVLAHPGVQPVDHLIPAMVEAGLAGLEVYHSEHDAPTSARYLGLAERYGLAVTGGSDYHGPMQMHHELGVPHVPNEVLDGLEAAWRASREA